MAVSADFVRKKFPRFRVLVMGRRNAGKTTLLRRMAGAEDDEAYEIRDRQGRLIHGQSILAPTAERGLSDIENEFTFLSNPSFVFHDSRGIEAGAEMDDESQLCVDNIRGFITRMAQKQRLKDRLHAIWFCMPMDTPRVPSESFELKFLEMDTAGIPLIAVFTKFESMVDISYKTLRNTQGRTEARKNAVVEAERIFKDSVLKAVQAAPHPPAQFVRLQHMDRTDANCADLLYATTESLQDDTMVTLFSKAQAVSARVGCYIAMRWVLGKTLLEKMREAFTEWTKESRALNVSIEIMDYLPFWYWSTAAADYNDDVDDDDRYRYRGRVRDVMADIAPKVAQLIPWSAFTVVPTTKDLVTIASVILVIGVKTGRLSKRPWTVIDDVLPLITKSFVEDVAGCVGANLEKSPEGVVLEEVLADMVMGFADSLK